MLSWLTLRRALICGHLNSGIGVGLVREPRGPQKKLGKSSFLEANLASISRDYSYNHSQIPKYRTYRWTGIPEKRWNTPQKLTPERFLILLCLIMTSPFISPDIWNHLPDACDFQVMTGRSYIKRNLRQSAGDNRWTNGGGGLFVGHW